MERKISLNGKWRLYYNDAARNKVDDFKSAESVEATVPGNVELDLKAAGLLPADEFKGMNTTLTEKYEVYEWWYNRTFTAPEFSSNEKVFLNFAGVDCHAEYFLNGEKILESKNAFIAHEAEVTNFLKSGENELTVHITSSVKFDGEHTLEQYCSSGWGCDSSVFSRKPAHAYGWDIFPRVVSAGLWKDVDIIIRDEYGIENVSYTTDFGGNHGTLGVMFKIKAPLADLYDNKLKVIISGKCDDSEFSREFEIIRDFNRKFYVGIDNLKLWWPYGYGDANIYDSKITLLCDGKEVANYCFNVGVRKIELYHTDTMLDENPGFYFKVNGHQVFCRGSNWVPLDAYHSRDKQRYAKALELVSDIGCNILRVWGGGVYEQEEFYDYCDRHGIMIWQDFMMACHICPEDPESMAEYEKEFTWAIKNLRNHPSIALWAGDNEIDSATVGNRNPNKNNITRKLLPSLINMYDYRRPYIPSSPYISEKLFKVLKSGNHNAYVENHLWGARDYYKADFYKYSTAAFVSETGYHGCPSVESLKKMVDEDKLWPVFNEQWTLHSSDQKGNDSRVRLMDDQIVQLFGKKAENIEDFSLASQISQAEAKKYFIERVRIGRPKTGGILWWNLLDGWPQMSDAVVDYFYDKKLAYYYIKRAQAPIALMMGELNNWRYTLYALNDTRTAVKGTYKVSDIETGEVIAEGGFNANANGKTGVTNFRMFYSEQRMLLIEWDIDGKKYYNHYLTGYPPFDFEKYKKWLNKLNEITAE